jgi:hypothetical protein
LSEAWWTRATRVCFLFSGIECISIVAAEKLETENKPWRCRRPSRNSGCSFVVGWTGEINSSTVSLIAAYLFDHPEYDLKMLKRVTLVGETTRGSAHAGVFHRIDDHFGMGIPEVRAVKPFSKTDWEGTGVEPDVKVKAPEALETAEKLAESKLQRK